MFAQEGSFFSSLNSRKNKPLSADLGHFFECKTTATRTMGACTTDSEKGKTVKKSKKVRKTKLKTEISFSPPSEKGLDPFFSFVRMLRRVGRQE